MIKRDYKPGDIVELVTIPNGAHSRNYKMSLDKKYVVIKASNGVVITTTDVPEASATLWVGRVKLSQGSSSYQRQETHSNT